MNINKAFDFNKKLNEKFDFNSIESTQASIINDDIINLKLYSYITKFLKANNFKLFDDDIKYVETYKIYGKDYMFICTASYIDRIDSRSRKTLILCDYYTAKGSSMPTGYIEISSKILPLLETFLKKFASKNEDGVVLIGNVGYRKILQYTGYYNAEHDIYVLNDHNLIKKNFRDKYIIFPKEELYNFINQ